MELTKKQVKDVAKLARLGLTEKEKAKFQKDFSAVLDFFAKLNELKTDKIEPTAHITGLENVSRRDRAVSGSENLRKNLINSAPVREGDQIKVKSIL